MLSHRPSAYMIATIAATATLAHCLLENLLMSIGFALGVSGIIVKYIIPMAPVIINIKLWSRVGMVSLATLLLVLTLLGSGSLFATQITIVVGVTLVLFLCYTIYLMIINVNNNYCVDSVIPLISTVAYSFLVLYVALTGK